MTNAGSAHVLECRPMRRFGAIVVFGAVLAFTAGCSSAVHHQSYHNPPSTSAPVSVSSSSVYTPEPLAPPTTSIAPEVTTPPPAPRTTPTVRDTSAAPPPVQHTTAAPPPPAPPKTSAPAQASYVSPGAYCSPSGAHGYTKTGKYEVCSTTAASPDRARWHSAS